MKVITDVPHIFVSGVLLDPNLLNDNLNYLSDAITTASEKRYGRSPLLIQFMEDTVSGYNNTLSTEKRTFRLFAPRPIDIEGAFFYYKGTGADVTVDVTDVTTATVPEGLITPYLEASATGAVDTDIASQQLTIDARNAYKFQLTSTGVFTAQKADLVLHLKTDRYLDSNGDDVYQEPDLVLLSESDDLSVSTFDESIDNITSAADINFAEGNAAPYKHMLFTIHNFTSVTASGMRRIDIPRAYNGDKTFTIAGMAGHVVMNGAGSADQNVTWQLEDKNGVLVASVTMMMSGLTYGYNYFDDAVIDLASSDDDIKSTSAEDYRVVVNTTGGTATVFKAYCEVWSK